MSYNTTADYSEATEEKNLSFKVELDTLNCVLTPNQNEKQKFSYIVTDTSSDDDSHADLEYIIFSIDEKITTDQIQNVTVNINGKSQNVKFNKNNNDNVILVSLDENTGCTGLKFEFGLSKTSDVMIISFELSEAYEVGSVPVCLYGNEMVKTGLAIGGPKANNYNPDGDKDKDQDSDKDQDDEEYGKHGEWFDTLACEEVGCKVFDVYVPVSIKPYAHVYKPDVKYLDKVEILSGCIRCDNEYESCDFTITQKLCVKVPVKYGVQTYYDRVCVNDEDCDTEHAYK